MVRVSAVPARPSPRRISNLMQRICGPPRDFTIEHQVSNWLAFWGIGAYALMGIENTLLGISPTWGMFVFSAAMLVGYRLLRGKRMASHTFLFAWLGFYLLASTAGWLGNEGIYGSTPMLTLLAVYTSYTIFPGTRRWLVIGLILAHFAALTALQFARPEWITPYGSPTIKAIDLSFSLALTVLYGLGYIGILTYNLNQRRAQADSLLLNILPASIAEDLKYAPEKVIARDVPQASVLFADVDSFTPLSADLTAAEVVELLNEVFCRFDELVEQRGLEKIKTIGDCYMVAAGVPEAREDHALILADLALEMQRYVQNDPIRGKQLHFRIGIHSGPLIAGVIGRRKFSYDLWGDTVNTASRMESHGVSGRIQVTEATYELIREQFVCEPRGTIAVKGKGEMPVWFVVSRA